MLGFDERSDARKAEVDLNNYEFRGRRVRIDRAGLRSVYTSNPPSLLPPIASTANATRSTP